MEKGSEMSSTSIQADIEILAQPYSGNRKGMLATAARHIRVSFRMIKSLYYNEIEDPEHLAMRTVRREAALKRAQKEARDLAATYKAIAGGMNAKDAERYRTDVAALLHAARLLGDVDRSEFESGVGEE